MAVAMFLLPRLLKSSSGLNDAQKWRLLEMALADPQAPWAYLGLSLVVGGMATASLQDIWSVGWASIGVVLGLLSVRELHAFPQPPRFGPARPFKNRFVTLACAQGLHAGCASLVLVLSHNSLLWLMVAGFQLSLLTQAIARTSPVVEAACAQICLTGVPLIVACELLPDTEIRLFGGLVALYVCGCLGAVRHLHTQAVGLLIADTENALLSRREIAANAELVRTRRQLEILSRTDVLTGVASRRQFDRDIYREWLRAVRAGAHLGLLLVDLDRFAALDVALGAEASDECLRVVARCIAGSIHRPADLAARLGGGEFAVLLPETDGYGMIDTAERIRAAVQAMRLPGPGDSPVTISVGAALFSAGSVCGTHAVGASEGAAERAIHALMDVAESKLAEARLAGGNCVRGSAEAAVTCNIPPR